MIRSLAFTTQGRLHSRNLEMLLMPTLLADTNLFLWVDLEGPTPEEAKTVLEDVFHFHPLSIEDCRMPSPSPKVEEYTPRPEDKFTPYLFIVIHAVDYSRKDGLFATSELNFFLGKNFLVTYHETPLKSISQTEEQTVKGTVQIARAVRAGEPYEVEQRLRRADEAVDLRGVVRDAGDQAAALELGEELELPHNSAMRVRASSVAGSSA